VVTICYHKVRVHDQIRDWAILIINRDRQSRKTADARALHVPERSGSMLESLSQGDGCSGYARRAACDHPPSRGPVRSAADGTGRRSLVAFTTCPGGRVRGCVRSRMPCIISSVGRFARRSRRTFARSSTQLIQCNFRPSQDELLEHSADAIYIVEWGADINWWKR